MIPLFLLIPAPSLPAQTVVATPDPVCGSCSIRLESVAVLGRLDDSVSLHGGSKVIRSRGGLFFASPTYSEGQVAVFDGSGRFLRVLGRHGDGPGELSAVDFLELARADSVVVFGPGRAIVIAGEPSVARDIRIPFAARGAAVLEDGRLVVHGYHQGPETSGQPLHLLSAEGVHQSSFGGEGTAAASGDIATRTRWLAPSSRPGAFWVTRPNAYEIELWDTAGTRRLTIQRQPPWFTEWDSFEPGGPRRSRPHSQVVDIGEDSAGRLWVLSYTADADWRPASPGGREARISPSSQDATFDSVLDVIDAATGEVLASTTLDGAAAGFAGPGVLYLHEEDQSGLVSIRVFTVHLDATPTRGDS